jgi:hypothetical protein
MSVFLQAWRWLTLIVVQLFGVIPVQLAEQLHHVGIGIRPAEGVARAIKAEDEPPLLRPSGTGCGSAPIWDVGLRHKVSREIKVMRISKRDKQQAGESGWEWDHRIEQHQQ